MKQNIDKFDNSNKAVTSTDILRIQSEGHAKRLTDYVVVEQPITIMIDKVGSFTVMATPSDIEALAIGFVYSEGLIESIDDVIAVSTKPQLPNVVGIEVNDPTHIAIQRNMIVASSCGMCGTRNIDKMLTQIPPCKESLKISSNMLIEIIENLRSRQQIFQATGGSHAAGIFDASGNIIAFAEDLGRHSALDKAIGKCLLGKISTKGLAVVLSGRISLEMVTKAAKAGIELIVAVSAPSSFAIEAAKQWNMTLCGFVRSDKLNVYTHLKRIRK